MKDKYKALSRTLSDDINKYTMKFILDNLYNHNTKDGEYTSDLIDLVLSSHLSSMASAMRFLSIAHPEMKETVDKFLNELFIKIKDIHPITNIEIN